MGQLWDYLFGAASFVPHGVCLLWRPDLVAMHAISDLLIAVAYFSIPVGLWYFTKHRSDLEFKPLFFLFASFILFCGFTHLIGLITLWYPIYGFQGLVKLATAVISLISAYALWPAIPRALAMPGITGLRKTNEQLALSISEREAMVEARTAELMAAHRELDTFASSLAHDLRGPLRSINGFSEALADDHKAQLDDSGNELIGRIRLATLRMSNLIDDLLGMSRITRTQIRISEVDISDMAEQILSQFKQNDPKRKVATEITPDILVECDPELMRVALTHLIANAWKFTANRADAKIELGWRKEGDKDVCCLRDNGAGFDMAYADKLFVPFQRLHSPDDFAGRGIGLAIVARIIHRHGGDIAAESSLGKGTTITFTLRSNRVAYHDQRSHIAR